jgi:hypothetical protein
MADDPIGTVRREDLGGSAYSIWLRMAVAVVVDYTRPVDVRGQWRCVHSTEPTCNGNYGAYSQSEVDEWPVIGAVPGTPAAVGLLAAPDPDRRRITAEMAAGLAMIAEMVGLSRETDEPEVIVNRVRERLAAPAQLRAAATNSARVAYDRDGHPWREVEPDVFRADCEHGAQCASPDECDMDEAPLADIVSLYGLRSLGLAASAAPAGDEATFTRVRDGIEAALHAYDPDGPVHWYVDNHTIDCDASMLLDVAARAALAALRGEQQ